MARYLVLANQTLGGERLLAEIQRRADEGDCHLYVVVPATGADVEPGQGGVAASGPTSSMPAGSTPATDDVERARRRAFDRLKEATARFQALGCSEVRGDVGDPDPVDAAEHALKNAGPFDEVIVSTLPRGMSKWLGLDLVSKIKRRTDLPVTHVEARSEATPE